MLELPLETPPVSRATVASSPGYITCLLNPVTWLPPLTSRHFPPELTLEQRAAGKGLKEGRRDTRLVLEKSLSVRGLHR